MTDTGWVSRSAPATKVKASNEKQGFSSGPYVPGLDDEQPSPPADTTLPPDVLSKVESRAEVDSLGDLQERRRTLMKQLAPLAALHGNFGKWEAKRSQMARAIRMRARAALIAEGVVKPTDKMVDDRGGADEQYEKFVDEGISGHIDYLNMQTELLDLQERISSREVEIRAYSAEAFLAR